MDKKILKKLGDILDWCFWQMDPDRKMLEDELTKLLEEAYSRGWNDAKDDSLEEEGLCIREDECDSRDSATRIGTGRNLVRNVQDAPLIRRWGHGVGLHGHRCPTM